MVMITAATASRHELVKSGLYRLPSMAALAAVLHWKKTPSALRALCHRLDNWDEFQLERVGKKPRDVQAPKPATKALQRRLNDLLKRIEPPDYLHSGTPGRSYLSNSGAHMPAKGATATVDISDFYPSVTRKRVFMLFRELFECAPDVADALADLMCCGGHLATGSPASALVSFYACQDMFDSMQRRAGERGATLTLYVDDITITGEAIGHGDVEFFERELARYGFSMSKHKSHVYKAKDGKLITGRVVSAGVSRAPNKRHLEMHRATQVVAAGNATEQEARSAIGKLQHVGGLDKALAPKLMERARRIRATIASHER